MLVVKLSIIFAKDATCSSKVVAPVGMTFITSKFSFRGDVGIDLSFD